MTGDLIPANVLAPILSPNVSETLAEKLGLPQQYRSIGIITADSDDVTYCALDEATKAAAVEVVYGRSLYAGAGNASTKLAGEVIGILAGPNPAEVQSGCGPAPSLWPAGWLPLRQRGRLHRLFCPHRLPHGHLSVQDGGRAGGGGPGLPDRPASGGGGGAGRGAQSLRRGVGRPL